MTESDVKDQILHSLGTLSAVEMVFSSRIKAYAAPTAAQVIEVFGLTIREFEQGFLKHLKKSS
jgi:hypothetical protein